MHVFDQIALQAAAKEGMLLLDESAGGRVGQVFDGLAAQDRQLAPFGVLGAELAVMDVSALLAFLTLLVVLPYIVWRYRQRLPIARWDAGTRNHAAGDDFYEYVNEDWLASYDLPADKMSIGAADALIAPTPAHSSEIATTHRSTPAARRLNR